MTIDTYYDDTNSMVGIVVQNKTRQSMAYVEEVSE